MNHEKAELWINCAMQYCSLFTVMSAQNSSRFLILPKDLPKCSGEAESISTSELRTGWARDGRQQKLSKKTSCCPDI